MYPSNTSSYPPDARYLFVNDICRIWLSEILQYPFLLFSHFKVMSLLIPRFLRFENIALTFFYCFKYICRNISSTPAEPPFSLLSSKSYPDYFSQGVLPVNFLHCLFLHFPVEQCNTFLVTFRSLERPPQLRTVTSTSRWKNLPSVNTFYCQACSGLSHPSYCLF